MNGQPDSRALRIPLGILAVLTLSGMILEAERAAQIPALSMTLRDQQVMTIVPGV